MSQLMVAWNQVQSLCYILFVCFNILKLLVTFKFQQKIIELKVKEYKELALHVQSEMEKLVWGTLSYMYIFVNINCK